MSVLGGHDLGLVLDIVHKQVLSPLGTILDVVAEKDVIEAKT